jgi:hypothetical protein
MLPEICRHSSGMSRQEPALRADYCGVLSGLVGSSAGRGLWSFKLIFDSNPNLRSTSRLFNKMVVTQSAIYPWDNPFSKDKVEMAERKADAPAWIKDLDEKGVSPAWVC